MASTTDLDLTSSNVDAPTYRSSAVVTPTTSGLADGSSAVTLADRGALAKIMVRCDPESAAASWMGVKFGGCRTAEPGVIVAGLRPDEFWLIGSGDAVASVRSAVPGSGIRAEVDLTHGRTLIEVAGQKATKLLEKVCGLDLSDNMTPAGSATSASVAKVSCDIVRSDNSYFISCDRSFGQYLMESLADAGREFGLTLGD